MLHGLMGSWGGGMGGGLWPMCKRRLLGKRQRLSGEKWRQVLHMQREVLHNYSTLPDKRLTK